MKEEGKKPALTGTHIFNLFAGVILPAISITIEATTHICAENLFDPIPTVWHLLLVIFVPLAQLQVWFTIRRGAPDRLTLAGAANAIAMAISIFYSIVYVPLFPIALLMAVLGIGLLPLAPYSSLLACILVRRHLKRIASNTAPKLFWIRKAGLLAGLSLTLALIGLIELPSSLTRYGLRLAVSESPEIQAKGIRFLRSYGSEDYLLRRCYDQTGWATDIVGYLFDMRDPVTPSEARKIYYRVTGETFDTFEPPKRIGGRLVPQAETNFDRNQAGQTVGAKLKELSLASSQLDASADADGGVAYMQWTLVFQNDSQQQREARAEIQLPPGGVVSRLTLWVNGEEREAAFAGRSQVRQAYQQVVARRRDPVLVTTAGRDRILVQCFPVPPDKGRDEDSTRDYDTARFGRCEPCAVASAALRR
ncbi:MAG TPA: VIT domain-containing protein [Pyrinomonadaceae bacterium]|nr:VIT domain-containing protein [Pyrinomonadaceae bacterium]